MTDRASTYLRRNTTSCIEPEGLFWVSLDNCILVVIVLSYQFSPSLCYPCQQLQGILDSQGVWPTLSFP